jgi:hypothetical protein
MVSPHGLLSVTYEFLYQSCTLAESRKPYTTLNGAAHRTRPGIITDGRINVTTTEASSMRSGNSCQVSVEKFEDLAQFLVNFPKQGFLW